ncbi:MAG: A/G-specific adenine glycosylase [Leptospirillia bacterium]
MSPTDPPISPQEAPVAAILAWYDAGHRDLPWRQRRDPYRIWVSEIMLQQTTVATVLRFYDRFLARFPDVGSLAEADLTEVLRFWSGLGYYQRARNLHRAARIVAGRGCFPESGEEWAELPGIGRSTAGAIFSISRNLWAPILDANVRRVVERFFAVGREEKKREARLWELSDSFGRENSRPGDTNQALMELGATVCLPASPRCSICPIRTSCRSREEDPDRISLVPVKRRQKRPSPPRRDRLVLLPSEGALLFVPRREGRLLEGLFDLYGIASSGIPPGTLLVEGPFAGCRVREELFTVTHTYSHFREVVHVAGVEGRGTEYGGEEAREEMGVALPLDLALDGRIPLTGVARKILRELVRRRKM